MAKNQTNNTTNRSTQKTTNRTQQKTTNTSNTTARVVDFHPSLGAPNLRIEISTARQSCISLGHFLASLMNIHRAQQALP